MRYAPDALLGCREIAVGFGYGSGQEAIAHFGLGDRDAVDVAHDVKLLEADTLQVELDGFSHYMLKEIYEQPESLKNAMRGRLDDQDATAIFGGLNLTW